MSNNPKVFQIKDWYAVEVASSGSSDRYLTICNEGPSRVFACIGGVASTENYNNVFDPGFNSCDFRIDEQKLSLICPRGQSAQVRIGVIELSRHEKLKALSARIFPALLVNGFMDTFVETHEIVPIDYHCLAQEALKAAQVLMKEWEAADEPSDKKTFS